MKTRIVLGSMMIALLAGLFWLDWQLEKTGAMAGRGLPMVLVFLPIWGGAFIELRRLGRSAGMELLVGAGMAGTILLAATPFIAQFLPARASPWLLALLVLWLTVVATFVEQMARNRIEGGLIRVVGTLGAVVYLGVGGAVILGIRIHHGMGALVLFLGAVKSTDIGAYFTGSAIGKHKLIPWLSPGKSWEGLVGGLATAAGMSVLLTSVLGLAEMPVWRAAIFGLAVGLAGQFGDLCESLLKRSAQVKDSGSALPQFGGVLDVIDSPLLAGPVALIILELYSTAI